MDKSPEKGRAAIMKKLLRPLTAALLAALLLTAGCAGAAILPAGGTNPLFETWTGIEAVRAVVLCQSLTGRDRPNGEAVHTFLNGDTFLTWETDGEWINAYYSNGPVHTSYSEYPGSSLRPSGTCSKARAGYSECNCFQN